MPFTDSEARRAYDREYKRAQRAGCPSPGPTRPTLPPEMRLVTARDVLALLGEQMQVVREDDGLRTTERARCLAYLAGVALKAIEAGDMAARLEALEAVLKARTTV